MFLLKQVETYRVETDKEAKDFIEKVTKEQFENGYKLTKSSSTYKTHKTKGEIDDEWYQVEVTKTYDYEV